MQLLKLYLVLTLSAGLIFTSVPNLYADETSEIILRILVEKGIISQEEVDAMDRKLAKEKPKVPETVEERLAVLEEKVEEKGFLSAKGVDFQLAGELEYEFVDTGGDGSDDNPHFQLDKLVLQPKLKIGDNFEFDAQLYFVEDGTATNLNEFHAKYTGLPLDSWVDAGLYERWVKGHHGRKTEAYSLLGTAFYRDDALTLTLGGDLDPIYWMLSVGNGYEINRKQVAEDTANNNDILHDNYATSGLSNRLEYGINLGLKRDFKGAGNVDIMGFYYDDQLSSTDISTLKSNLLGYTSNNDTKTRVGAGIKYKLGNATLYGAYIDAEDGALDRDTWVVDASYHFKFNTDRKFFTGIEPVISYSDYNVDFTKATGSPLGWDREKWIFASIIDFYKNTKLKLEYYINTEDTGGEEVDNDEFLAQLEVKF